MELIFDQIEPIEQAHSDLTLFKPIEKLIGEYQQAKAKILELEQQIQCNPSSRYFEIKVAYQAVTISQVSSAAAAIKALNADYWSRAMNLTDVIDNMPASKRNEWHDLIREQKAPDFSPDAVRSTLQEMLINREVFFAQKVDEIFKGLSRQHITNRPEGFSKRMIMNYVFSEYGYPNHAQVQYISDLRGVVARLSGRGSEKNNRYIFGSTYDLLYDARKNQHGKKIEIDAGAIVIKAFKAGTLHLDIAPDIALEMNRILAKLYPTAIPSQFRSPQPTRKAKPVVVEKLLPIALLEELWDLRSNTNGGYLTVEEKRISADAQAILLKLDGKLSHGKTIWTFPYDIKRVLKGICESGRMPDDKSFQFYPTPDHVVERLIDLLDVDEAMRCMEPQAGTGAIAKKLPPNTMCYELSTMRSDILKAQGFRCENVDFLDVTPEAIYDRIAMNPPFDQGRAMHHFRHALKFLKPGGIIGAILPNGYYQKGEERVPYEGIELEHIETMHEQFGDAKVYVQLVIARKSL